uniref:Uncharacterized protein n=1 Tax=Panagrellus redivivus TaxID=6233 RepID=A0A7E4URP0_PANRE
MCAHDFRTLLPFLNQNFVASEWCILLNNLHFKTISPSIVNCGTINMDKLYLVSIIFIGFWIGIDAAPAACRACRGNCKNNEIEETVVGNVTDTELLMCQLYYHASTRLGLWCFKKTDEQLH